MTMRPARARRGARRGRRLLAAALLLLSVAWLVAIEFAPYALARRDTSGAVVRAAGLAYLVGALVCHQQPDRSFHVAGVAQPVCARCAGLYAAAPVGLLLGLLAGRRDDRGSGADRISGARRALLVAAAPTVVTVVLEQVWQVPVAGWVRALAAAPLAGAIGWVVAVALQGGLDDPRLEYTDPAGPSAPA